ncbi:hypothetical protein VTL71DRAFT_1151 [Oculimacula yallundae]|uniref:Uncharacterized protein n=1 Tax=Oculimacula yallundae TaxID=86028 RepID=A0ABR4D3I9_9HELO
MMDDMQSSLIQLNPMCQAGDGPSFVLLSSQGPSEENSGCPVHYREVAISLSTTSGVCCSQLQVVFNTSYSLLVHFVWFRAKTIWGAGKSVAGNDPEYRISTSSFLSSPPKNSPLFSSNIPVILSNSRLRAHHSFAGQLSKVSQIRNSPHSFA